MAIVNIRKVPNRDCDGARARLEGYLRSAPLLFAASVRLLDGYKLTAYLPLLDPSLPATKSARGIDERLQRLVLSGS
jgi:hypothetical protein